MINDLKFRIFNSSVILILNFTLHNGTSTEIYVRKKLKLTTKLNFQQQKNIQHIHIKKYVETICRVVRGSKVCYKHTEYKLYGHNRICVAERAKKEHKKLLSYLDNKIMHDFNFFFLLSYIVNHYNKHYFYNKKNISCQRRVKEKSLSAIWK